MPWLTVLRPPVLENTGSTARDHLALERTYLAWLRTSLTLTSVGIALSQFFRLPRAWSEDDRPQWHDADGPASGQSRYHNFRSPSYWLRTITVDDLAKPMGSAFILIGILTLLFGTSRYFAVQAQLMRTSYVPSRLEVITITFLVGALLSAVLAVIFASPETVPRPSPGLVV